VITATEPIPIAIEEVHGGLSDARGSLRVDDMALIIEVQVRLLYYFEGATRTVRLDITDLDTVSHKRGIARDTLTLRTLGFDDLDGLPGARGNQIKLFVSKKDRDRLDPILDRLRLWIR
jgi:hypothetical protein